MQAKAIRLHHQSSNERLPLIRLSFGPPRGALLIVPKPVRFNESSDSLGGTLRGVFNLLKNKFLIGVTSQLTQSPRGALIYRRPST